MHKCAQTNPRFDDNLSRNIPKVEPGGQPIHQTDGRDSQYSNMLMAYLAKQKRKATGKDNMTTALKQGFYAKCAQLGINPAVALKHAGLVDPEGDVYNVDTTPTDDTSNVEGYWDPTPSTPKTIAAIEQKLGKKFPAALKQIWIKQTPLPSDRLLIPGDTRPRPLDHMLSASGNVNHYGNLMRARKWTVPEYMPESFVSFAEEANGNAIGLDYSSGKPVVAYWNHEGGDITPINSSFVKFWRGLKNPVKTAQSEHDTTQYEPVEDYLKRTAHLKGVPFHKWPKKDQKEWDEGQALLNKVEKEEESRKVAQVRPSKTSPYKGMGSLAFQQFAPIAKRRNFSPAEQEDIAAGESKIIPKIWQSYETPMYQLLASPAKTGIMSSVPGALAGGALGYLAGGREGAGIGAVGGGALTGFLGYFSRRQRNENIKELMRRLPPHATKRDMLSDPAYQADVERQHQLMLAKLQAQTGE